jgi:periplasmic protein CpxP/Spy
MSLSKNKSLIFIITALLLINILVVGYFLWFKKPHRPVESRQKGHKGIATALQNEVGFNEQQVAQYRELKEKQWTAIKPMFSDLCRVKDSLFRLLSNENTNDSVINKAADVIARQQKAVDIQVFNHFKQIRTLCTPEQLPKYDSLVQHLIKKMGPCQGKPGNKDNK